ncbi:MAG: hypothetical protein HY670_11915 [Chloroflexi bacterium]|nr:hypothetical protein [Chloroflexota bacterium]
MKVNRVTGINALCQKGTLDQVAQFFRDVLGAEIAPEMMWRRKYGMRARAAWLGDFRVELSESTDDTLPAGKQHRTAPSFQILGVTVDNLDETIAELKAGGIKTSEILVTEDPEHQSPFQRWIWVHPRDTFGLIIEVIEEGRPPWPQGGW